MDAARRGAHGMTINKKEIVFMSKKGKYSLFQDNLDFDFDSSPTSYTHLFEKPLGGKKKKGKRKRKGQKGWKWSEYWESEHKRRAQEHEHRLIESNAEKIGNAICNIVEMYFAKRFRK